MDGRTAVRERYGVGPADKLGAGGESEVYALGHDRVLRLHRHEAAAYTRRIGELYAKLDRAAVPFDLPEVLDVQQDGDTSWSIERRLPGRPLDALLATLGGRDRERALTAYVDGAAAFGALGVPHDWPGGCGELFTDEQLHAARWGDLLAPRLALQLERARPVVADHVPAFDAVAERIVAEARGEPSSDVTLVHGDWFPATSCWVTTCG